MSAASLSVSKAPAPTGSGLRPDPAVAAPGCKAMAVGSGRAWRALAATPLPARLMSIHRPAPEWWVEAASARRAAVPGLPGLVDRIAASGFSGGAAGPPPGKPVAPE